MLQPNGQRWKELPLNHSIFRFYLLWVWVPTAMSNSKFNFKKRKRKSVFFCRNIQSRKTAAHPPPPWPTGSSPNNLLSSPPQLTPPPSSALSTLHHLHCAAWSQKSLSICNLHFRILRPNTRAWYQSDYHRFDNGLQWAPLSDRAQYLVRAIPRYSKQ